VKVLGIEKSIIPVGAFGGAGREILRMLEHIRDERAFPKYSYRKVLAREPWDEESLNTSLYALRVKEDPSVRRKIFINNRRADTAAVAAGFIARDLEQRFSKDNVFFDQKSIATGDYFEEVIQSNLEQTAIFVCLIGKDWLTIAGDDGIRRLDKPDDFVRREIEIALESGVKIVPMLFDLDKMVEKSALPDSIKKLTGWHGIAFDRVTVEEGVQELIRSIEAHFASGG
jgi:hypothetical protein